MLEHAHRMDGRRGRRRLPPVCDDASTFAVYRSYEAIHAHSVGKPLCASAVGDTVLEERRSDDHFSRADCAQLGGALGRTNAAPDLAGQARADVADQIVVRARVHRSVKVDDVDAAKARKTFDPIVEIGGLNGELLALDELDDLAAF